MKKLFSTVSGVLFLSACSQTMGIQDNEPVKNFDWEKYITFEPDNRLDEINKIPLTAKTKQSVINALSEIAQTPEGQKIIMLAYDQRKTGTINIGKEASGISDMGSNASFRYDKIDGSAVNTNNISLSDVDYTVRYKCNRLGVFVEASLQRILYHELFHLAYHRGNSVSSAATNFFKMSEIKTVKATDVFMDKYYNECPREKYLGIDLNGDGKPKYNSHFSI